MQLISLKSFAEGRSDYTEIRQHENTTSRIALLNGDITVNSRAVEGGVSSRVRRNGVWGLAAGHDMSKDGVERVVSAALDNAEKLGSVAAVGQKGTWPSKPGVDSHDFRTKKDKLSPKEVIDILKEADAYVKEKCPKLISRRVIYAGFNHEKNLVTSDGAESYIFLPRSHIYVVLIAEREDGQPADLFDIVNGGRGEFEDFFMDLSEFKRVTDITYENLMKKCEGVLPEAGTVDCILMPDLAGILAHEAIGHTVEADLVKLGSVAGDNLNKTVASELVTLIDYAHTKDGVTCDVPVYVDDEGVKAEDVTVIDKGILKEFLHNKETAMEMGAEVKGNARGFAYGDEPLIRMRNTAIVPGNSKLDDMIASIDNGYIFQNTGNGQADTTGEFMFGVSMGFEVKGGKLGRAILDTTVTGIAFDMLKTVTMVSGDDAWTSSGFCGKKQMMSVGMGGPAIKCKINVGGQ
ncbi:MAG: TldD/PmbA family protein [Oscillospiraceae bacterium]|nr:TldD/PmbA family protein [Oscillospiraceae bacterium]